MQDVTIKFSRFDENLNEDLIRISKDFAKAFGWTADSLTLDKQLAQLLRLRVSQINHCTYCMNLHAQAARDSGIHPSKVDTLSAWWETAFYSEAEQAALAYTDALCRQSETSAHDKFEGYHQALTEHFSQEEIAEIAGIVINMNVWTRLKMAAGAVPSF